VNPATEQLRAFLNARDDADAAVGPNMRSSMLEGPGDEVVLLLHGLTASPPAWASIAADLNAAGATVVNVRLPLHGHLDRMTTALEGLSVDLLTSDLREIVVATARLGKRIIIGGHSLGGTLAVHAAATIPQVERIVAIAPFLGIVGLPRHLHAVMLPLVRRLPNLFLWWDPVERERQGPAHGYPRYPLRALAVGLGIADAVFADSRRTPPARAIDLVINAQESSVNNAAVQRLAARWRAVHAPVAVHRLDGLPPSHDIIEPLRAHSTRARETIVRLLLGERSEADTVYHII
jgi:pimeloyl-ACP methyl ester carboxylesterase